MEKLRNKHLKKLENLIIRCSSRTSENHDWVCNLTNVDIPNKVKTFMSYGPKFAIPPEKSDIHWPKIISEVESITNAIEEDDIRDELRMDAVNILKNYKTAPNSKDDYLVTHLKQTFKETRYFMKDNKDDIMLMNADKGGKTVVVSKEEYLTQMNKLLEDKSTYKKVNYDPTKRVQRKSNSLLKGLRTDGCIDKRERRNLSRYNSVAPKLYGLPKIHKLSTTDNSNRELANNYPSGVRNKLFAQQQQLVQNTQINVQPKPTHIYRSFTNIPVVTAKLQKIIRTKFPSLNIKIVPRNIKTSKTFFTNPKDKICPEQESHIIYAINCSCEKLYIGLTTQYKHTRKAQHENEHNQVITMKNNNLRNSQAWRETANSCTALVKHVMENDHQFDFNQMETLDRGRRWNELKMLEMVHIKKNEDKSINLKSDVANLHSIYNTLI
ncbi:CLUMA_CG009147, isoform A [Clunio marinus]|uniref:CLUMA_CG009147, isoform A n=1 Tax=Clunio marinus TaxID=568069 RepID=A0A1J1IB72_9DIPT|nr:CLUMA_CG009147, isoform A [Clunio marinus]